MTVLHNLGLPAQPTGVEAGDLNNDGFCDIVVANFSPANSVSIFLNNGNGGFLPRTDVFVAAIATSVRLGDFNSDGSLDLAVSLRSVVDRHVGVLFNDGLGGFSPVFTKYIVGLGPEQVDVGDLDADGSLDIVVACYQSDVLSVLMNTGAGLFAPGVNYNAGTSPTAVRAGDMDGDGDLDLVVTNKLSSFISVFDNDGTGSFPLRVDHNTTLQADCIALSDIDSDGDLDVAVGVSFTTHVDFFQNDGTALLTPAGNATTGYKPFAIVQGDFDNDGAIDIATTNDGLGGAASISVLLNNSPVLGYASQYGFNAGGANILSLNTNSTPQESATTILDLSGVPTGTSGLMLFSLNMENTALEGGTLLAEFPFVALISFPVANGTAAMPVWLPSGSVGLTVYIQAVAFESTLPLGLAFSNGLKLLIGD